MCTNLPPPPSRKPSESPLHPRRSSVLFSSLLSFRQLPLSLSLSLALSFFFPPDSRRSFSPAHHHTTANIAIVIHIAAYTVVRVTCVCVYCARMPVTCVKLGARARVYIYVGERRKENRVEQRRGRVDARVTDREEKRERVGAEEQGTESETLEWEIIKMAARATYSTSSPLLLRHHRLFLLRFYSFSSLDRHAAPRRAEIAKRARSPRRVIAMDHPDTLGNAASLLNFLAVCKRRRRRDNFFARRSPISHA